MVKYFACTFLSLCYSIVSLSQDPNYITGQVTAESNGSAVSDCSVFLNNTSRGTLTNATGNFELTHLPTGKHDLICSSIGYETIVFSFSDKDLPLHLNIHLKLKATELEAVTVEPFLKNGWREWGQFFLDNFIGKGDNAYDCTIKNTKAIRFRFSKKKNKLSAVSDEPLIIENKALGYTISYQLEEFSYTANDHVVVYLGYPLFTEMNPSSQKIKARWLENRKKAYRGSTAHFIKSLYNNNLVSEGFEIRAIHGKGKTEIGSDHITADSIVTVNDEMEKSLFFQDRLEVKFKYDAEMPPYWSIIYLVTPSPVLIEANGNYHPPQEIGTLGYWSYSEKLCNLLPLDE